MKPNPRRYGEADLVDKVIKRSRKTEHDSTTDEFGQEYLSDNLDEDKDYWNDPFYEREKGTKHRGRRLLPSSAPTGSCLTVIIVPRI